jgi:hypothetical protein
MHHILFIVAAVSGGFEDLQALDSRISAIAPQAEQVDKRLKLAQCPDTPIVAPPVGGAVIVRCPALGWRLRVHHHDCIGRRGRRSAGPRQIADIVDDYDGLCQIPGCRLVLKPAGGSAYKIDLTVISCAMQGNRRLSALLSCDGRVKIFFIRRIFINV